MKIHIPEFKAMAICNKHMDHGPIDIDLGEDVVEIVRCRDCKHYKAHPKSREIKACFQHLNPVFMPDDGFCSYGERKDNG